MTDIKNLTPAHLRCEWGACPSVHRLEDGRLLIVGDDGFPKSREVGIPCDSDEAVIIIHPDLLSTVMQEEIEKALLKDDFAASISKRVAELPDRSSPDDWPEAMLVTAEELEFIVVDELLDRVSGSETAPSEIEKAVKAERERCAKIAYQFAEEADQGGKETPAGKQARKIGNAIRFSPVQGDEG